MKTEQNPVVGYIKRRIKRNKNFMGIVCGETGSGKTYGAIALALAIDEEFDIEKQLVFTIKDFMNLLNNKTLKRGQVIIFDEAGTNMNSRTWYDVQQRLFNYVLQTFRHMGIVVFFTTPSFDFIDSHSRKLFHAYFEPMRINYKTKTQKMKMNLISNNAQHGKVYFKRMIVRREGVVSKINSIIVNKAPDELCRAYEIKKTSFTNELNEDIMQDVEVDSNAKKNMLKKLTLKQQQIYDLYKQGLNNKQIAAQLGFSDANVSQQMERIRRKGYDA